MLLPVLAFAAALQAALPPPHIDYRAPDSALITSTYRCVGKDITLVMSTAASTVSVSSYTSDGVQAPAEDLALWNQWISKFERLDAVSLSCERDNNQRIDVIGAPRPGAADTARRVTVHWRGGRIGRTF